MYKFSKFLTIGFGAALLLTQAACTNGGGDTGPGTTPPAATGNEGGTTAGGSGTLDVVIGSLAVSMDPTVSNDSSSALVNTQIYSTLLGQDYNTMETYPRLALNYEQVDARTINIELRPGVYFHNGMQMTSRDVQVSLERAGASAAMDPLFGMIDRIETHDDYNLTIHLQFDFAPMLRHLAHPGGSIIPAALVDAGHDFNELPIGTGAFMFESLVIDDNLVLVRNDNYWGDVAGVEKLVLRRVPDPGVRLIEASSGHAHIGSDVAVSDAAVAEADPNITLYRRQGISTNYIGFNTSMYPFDNVLVRQAISYALDTDAIFNAVNFGVGQVGRGFMSPATWAFHENLDMFPHNLERARELMIEAGYPDGFTAEIWWNTETAARRDMAEISQNMLRDLNINLEVVGMDWPTYLQRTENAEQGMFVLGWTSLGGDADYGLMPTFHTDFHGVPGNRSFLSDPILDDLLERGRGEMDETTRFNIYLEAQERIRYLAPWVPISHGEVLMAVRPEVQGFILNPAGHHRYSRVSLSN